jgi:hypothetical protein
MGLGGLEQLDERLARLGGDGGVISGSEVVGDGLQDGAALGEAGVDEAVGEGLAGGGRRFPDLFGLGRRHEAGLEGDITDQITMVVEHGGEISGVRPRRACAHASLQGSGNS